MIHNKSVLALILARGGSKRLPGKNIKNIGGKPMIAWSIEAAKNSKYLDRTIVSTDSQEIAEVSKKYGADIPFERPAELATDTAGSIDVVLHAINWLKENEKKEYDYILLLQATSPLRTSQHIDEAIEHIENKKEMDAVVSFYPWDKKPEWVYCKNQNGFLEACLETKEEFKTVSPMLMPNGAVYIIKTESFLKEKTFYAKKLDAYLMDREDSADVDEQYDFDLAEFFLKKRDAQKASVFINNIEINEGKKVFIIAEAGVNHNGELEKALALVDLAADIGADAVKFQTFKAHQVVTAQGEMAQYQKKNLGFEKSQLEMLQDIELPENFYPPLINRCKEKGILFLSTPHGGIESVKFLESIDLQAYKIGSGDITNYLLLDAVAQTKKPIILATGMSTLEEVKSAVEFIRWKGNDKIILLHCTSNYPCPSKDVNMAAMKTLMTGLNLPVGYSDHTQGNEAAIMATALGQALYEFHFTLDKNLPGPDHVASTSPEEARERVKAIRLASLMMGSSIKEPTIDEKQFTLPIARRSLVASKDLKVGQVITVLDLEAKRPANGLSAQYFEQLIGKKLLKDLKKDQQFSLTDVG